MRKLFLYLTIILGAACAPSGEQLIPAGDLQRAVRAQLPLQKELARHRQQELLSVFRQKLTPAEREALEWLYAWMPLSDLADYDGEFYLRQVRATLQARADMAWGRSIPDDLFLHFVLPLRVNNENLDSARVVLYGLLRERVQGLTMRQAALEVNHWCHEHVTYRGADMRTSAPLATMRSAIGRCGEESVFTVAALRAIGIPARQVYTPRWAHSDDNHAWVELWADGEWYFLGACEPEPDLNMGWFKEPARRAMLVHTRVMGPYAGEEEVLASSPRHREINVLGRYAEVTPLHVRIVSAAGVPVAGAEVSFRIYNYAEFYPLARRTSDATGFCSLRTGRGDLLIWAQRDSLTGFARAAGADTVVVTLQPGAPPEAILELDFAPPLARPPLPDTITEAARAAHARRLAFEDSLRKAYEATFMDSLASARLAAECGLEPDPVWQAVRRSRGNHAEIARFIRAGAAVRRHSVLPLLIVIAEKDLRDVPAEILLDHLEAVRPDSTLPRGLFERYLLNPRIRNEALAPWRQLLQEGMSREMGRSVFASPGMLANWVEKNIRLEENANYYGVPLTPRGVWELRAADPLSRDIFLVALCRSLNIPARLDPAFERPEYWDVTSQSWQLMDADAGGAGAAVCSLAFSNRDKTIARPEYWRHFTLARLEDGEYKTLELEGIDFSAGRGMLELPAGNYLLVTGYRLQSGAVLSRLHFFTLEPGQTRMVDLVWRHSGGALKALARLPEGALLTDGNGRRHTLKELARPEGLILAWLDPGREPSQHVLREWQELKPLYEEWGGRMAAVVVAGGESRLAAYSLPGQLMVVQDVHEEVRRRLGQTLGGELSVFPVLVYVNPAGEILWMNQGYQVGLGDRLLQVIIAAQER